MNNIEVSIQFCYQIILKTHSKEGTLKFYITISFRRMGDSSFALTFCLHTVLQIWSNNIWTFFLSYKGSEYKCPYNNKYQHDDMQFFMHFLHTWCHIIFWYRNIELCRSKIFCNILNPGSIFCREILNPPIRYWTGVQNIMATNFFTQFCFSISHWKRDSKYYDCKLNFLLFSIPIGKVV